MSGGFFVSGLSSGPLLASLSTLIGQKRERGRDIRAAARNRCPLTLHLLYNQLFIIIISVVSLSALISLFLSFSVSQWSFFFVVVVVDLLVD